MQILNFKRCLLQIARPPSWQQLMAGRKPGIKERVEARQLIYESCLKT